MEFLTLKELRLQRDLMKAAISLGLKGSSMRVSCRELLDEAYALHGTSARWSEVGLSLLSLGFLAEGFTKGRRAYILDLNACESALQAINEEISRQEDHLNRLSSETDELAQRIDTLQRKLQERAQELS
jgi:septal ring factor EnvC (AmiA/AmiB activator)